MAKAKKKAKAKKVVNGKFLVLGYGCTENPLKVKAVFDTPCVDNQAGPFVTRAEAEKAGAEFVKDYGNTVLIVEAVAMASAPKEIPADWKEV